MDQRISSLPWLIMPLPGTHTFSKTNHGAPIAVTSSDAITATPNHIHGDNLCSSKFKLSYCEGQSRTDCIIALIRDWTSTSCLQVGTFVLWASTISAIPTAHQRKNINVSSTHICLYRSGDKPMFSIWTLCLGASHQYRIIVAQPQRTLTFNVYSKIPLLGDCQSN